MLGASNSLSLFTPCRYTHCVVVPVDERDYFSKASKTVLTALLMGVPLVKQAWLEDSVQQGHLLPVQGYLPKVGSVYMALERLLKWEIYRLLDTIQYQRLIVNRKHYTGGPYIITG